MFFVAFCCVSSWVPTAAASRSAAEQHAAYVVPLQMRQGALRARSSTTTSSSRNLLGAGKVNVLGRCVCLGPHASSSVCVCSAQRSVCSITGTIIITFTTWRHPARLHARSGCSSVVSAAAGAGPSVTHHSAFTPSTHSHITPHITPHTPIHHQPQPPLTPYQQCT